MSLTPKQKQTANRTLTKLDSEKRRKIRELIGEVGASALNPIAEYLFDAAGNYTFDNPRIGSQIQIWFAGGGAGGGSGRKGAASSLRGGGQGGGASAVTRLALPISINDFPSQISMVVGAGGAGGAAQATNSTNGSIGSVGQDTTITINGSTAQAPGSVATGAAGTNNATASGMSEANAFLAGAPNASVLGTSPFSRWVTSRMNGGSIGTDDVVTDPSPNARSAQVPLATPGANALRYFGDTPFNQAAASPRGGSATLTGNAQNGGDGILGLGGAGGGAATDDEGNSGAGGRGGDGFVYIAVYA